MADFTKPSLDQTEASYVQAIRDMFVDLAKMLDGTGTSHMPTGAVRWNANNKRFEKFNGTAWEPLTDKYMINVDQVDGKHAGDFLPVNGKAANSAKLGGEIPTASPTPLTVVRRDGNGDTALRKLITQEVRVSHDATTRNNDQTFISFGSSSWMRKNTREGMQSSLRLRPGVDIARMSDIPPAVTSLTGWGKPSGSWTPISDLNDLTYPSGVYKVGCNTLHSPGVGTVIIANDYNHFRQQLHMDRFTGAISSRTYVSGSWTAWEKALTESSQRVTLKSSRTTAGTWTINGLIPWKPVFITTDGEPGKLTTVSIRAISGSMNYTYIYGGVLGRSTVSTDWMNVQYSDSPTLIPHKPTLVLEVKGPWLGGTFTTIEAYQ